MSEALRKAKQAVEDMKKRLDQAKAKKQAIEARLKTKQANEKRADDTRRKVLIGAMIYESMQTNEESRIRVLGRLDKFLTRPADRALFGLPPIT